MLKKKFLTSRLQGDRFEGGEIPLDILRDISNLGKVIFDIAKWKYQQHIPNTSDRKVNKYFAQYHLSVSKIEAGSAIFTLNLVNGNEQHELLEINNTVDEIIYIAVDELINTIRCANENDNVASVLPVKILKRVKQIGNNLLPNESIELSNSQYSDPVLFTTETRKYLDYKCSKLSQTELTNIQIRAFIPEVDKDEMKFHMEIADKKRIEASIPKQDLNKIVSGFDGYFERKRLLFEGKVNINNEGNIVEWESIDKVHLPETLDVPYSLELLKQLKDGWLDGDQGVAPNHSRLDWLGNIFIRYYPDYLTLPHTYPTPEGGIQMEWSFGNTYIEFEIDLTALKGEWFRYETSNDDKDFIIEVDLEKPDDWRKIVKDMEELVELSCE